VRRFAAAALCALAASAFAQLDPALPSYRPEPFAVPREPVKILGYNDMREMLEPLVRYFEAVHPGLRIDLELPGTRFAPAALARGESVLAPMGALFTPEQLAQYRGLNAEDAVAFRVAHASLDPKALSGPLAIFVHRDNPIASLTFEQAARIFSGEAKTWGDVGLSGEWATRPIATYGLGPNTALALEFHAAVMGDRAWSAAMKGVPQSAEVVEKLGADRAGVGFAAAMRASADVRIVPVARAGGEAAQLPTEEAMRAGRYALDRYLLIYARPPLSPLARDFLRLVLSREGQQAVAQTPQRYIPLTAPEAARERAKIDVR
jgi:phosphate transport system substrate-binding protein